MSTVYPPRFPMGRLAIDTDWNRMWDWISGSSIISSYVIYSGSGLYWARNGQTGLIVSSGSDAAIPLQDSLNQLSGSGGMAQLKEGTFLLNQTPIKLPTNIVLQGSGWKTVLKLADNKNTDIIRNQNFGTGSIDEGIIIKDLQIDGNKTNQTIGSIDGISLSGASRLKLINCDIHDCKRDAIKATGSGGHLYLWNKIRENDGIGISILNGATDMILFSNEIYSNVSHGISISSTNNIKISDGTINLNNGDGINILNSIAYINNMRINNSGGHGIKIKAGLDNTSNSCIINGCNLNQNNTLLSGNDGINLEAVGSNVDLLHCNIYSNVISGINHSTGIKTINTSGGNVDYLSISGNIITDASTKILASGSNNRIIGNID